MAGVQDEKRNTRLAQKRAKLQAIDELAPRFAAGILEHQETVGASRASGVQSEVAQHLANVREIGRIGVRTMPVEVNDVVRPFLLLREAQRCGQLLVCGRTQDIEVERTARLVAEARHQPLGDRAEWHIITAFRPADD